MLKAIVTHILLAGIKNPANAEERKKILATTIFSLVSIVMLAAFGVENLTNSRTILASVLLTTAFISLCNYLYLRLTGNYRHTSFVIVGLGTVLFAYLLVTGGADNTGHLWFFSLPTLIFFVLGLRAGTYFLLPLLLFVATVLFLPGNVFVSATYELSLALRFFGALLAVSVLAFVYEFTREDDRRELLALTEKLDRLSQTDELTGLANRRAMTTQIKHEIARFERRQRPFCLLVADIDYFKQVNDRHGHECGDMVLASVASALDRNTKKQDIVSRWGGEEFMILLPETDAGQGTLSAERLRQAIEELETWYGDHAIKVTISIGITEYRANQLFTELIKTADNLLYQAKRSGRNRIVQEHQ